MKVVRVIRWSGGQVNREYPQYTKPADFRGWKVPEVLLSGDHGKIREWRENFFKKEIKK